MSELLVYSPVNVELKEILIEEFPFSIYIPLNEGEMSYSVSIIYEIDNIEFEFDTNLNVSKKQIHLNLQIKFSFQVLFMKMNSLS